MVRLDQVAAHLWLRGESWLGVSLREKERKKLTPANLPQFPVNKNVQPEDLKSKWDVITRFDDKATYPNSTAESLEAIISNFANEAAGDDSGADYTDSEDSELVAKAKKEAQASGEYVYTERDVALYNIGVGATEKDLDLIFEQDENFQALPSFGVIPQCAFCVLVRGSKDKELLTRPLS